MIRNGGEYGVSGTAMTRSMEETSCEMMSAEQEGEPSESEPVSVERPDDGLEGRELAAMLEALLFVSPEPVSLSRLVTRCREMSLRPKSNRRSRGSNEDLEQEGPRHSAGQTGRRLPPGDQAGVCALAEAFGQSQGGRRSCPGPRSSRSRSLRTSNRLCAPRSKKFAVSKRPVC